MALIECGSDKAPRSDVLISPLFIWLGCFLRKIFVIRYQNFIGGPS